MEMLYDISNSIDLKEIWDSDIDSDNLALRLSADAHCDMHDDIWLLDRTLKMPQVILNDALLSGQPIKTEHSYSLNSDGDSLPDSPGSMHHQQHHPHHQHHFDEYDKSQQHQQQLLHAPQSHPPHIVQPMNGSNMHSHLLSHNYAANQASASLAGHQNAYASANLGQQQAALLGASANGHHGRHHHRTGDDDTDDDDDGDDDNIECDDDDDLLRYSRKSAFNGPTSKKRQRSASPASRSAIAPTAIYLPGRGQPQHQTISAQQLQQQQQQAMRAQRNNGSPNVLVKREPMSPTGSECSSVSLQRQSHRYDDSPMLSGGCDLLAESQQQQQQHIVMSMSDEEDDESDELDMSTGLDLNEDDDDDDDDEDDDDDDEDDGALLVGQRIVRHRDEDDEIDMDMEQVHGNGLLVNVLNADTKSHKMHANKMQRISTMAKLNIKMEPQQHQQALQPQQQRQQSKRAVGRPAYGLPPTPPSSLSSDGDFGDGRQSSSSPEQMMRMPQQQHQQQPYGVAGLMLSPPANGRRSSASGMHSNRSSASCSPSNRGGNGGGNASSASSTSGGYTPGTTSTRQPIHTPLISSQPKGSTGSLMLTEEEKRTLQAEGYPIPTRLPLTKAEEKSLKKIRRKIKNKISAQESRRKKKEYMDQLERKVEILVAERNAHQADSLAYQKRVQTLEDQNANYRKQLDALEANNASMQAQLSKLLVRAK